MLLVSYKTFPKNDDGPKVAFKDSAKPKVEDKGKLNLGHTRCFKCNGIGHLSNTCPNKRALVFQNSVEKWDEEEKDEDFDKGQEEDCDYISNIGRKYIQVEVSHGEPLDKIKGLDTQVYGIDPSIKRENIFHTKCHVGDKVCNLIIDSGSCTNMSCNHLTRKVKFALTQLP